VKALSGYPQWFWLLAKGWKDVENRSWPLPKWMRDEGLPVRIYLHGSQHLERKESLALARQLLTVGQYAEFCAVNWKQYQGTIFAQIDIIKYSFRHADTNANLFSPWHIPGQYGFYTSNPKFLDKPIPYKGRLGFFEVEVANESRGNFSVQFHPEGIRRC
jgi:hypothetical protein